MTNYVYFMQNHFYLTNWKDFRLMKHEIAFDSPK